MRLKGKVAFISGAGGPMGVAISERFIREGARLILVDVSEKRLSRLVESIGQDSDVMASASNVLDLGAVGTVVQNAVDRFGRIDILVNIVGGVASKSMTTPLLEIDDAQIDATVSLNWKSLFNTVRHILPLMQKHQYGRVVNLTSTAMAGEKGLAAYSATKAGIAALTRTMAIEFAPHVTVNCIAPSLIRTRVMELFDKATIDAFASRPLLRRIGEPEDVANAALFLSSDEASFITGVMLPVSGGAWPSL